LLIRFARFDADAAGGDLRILRADGSGDVVGGQAKSDQPRWIDPHPQRALGRIKAGAADAGNAADLALNVADQKIAEPDCIETAVGRAQRDDLEHGA
jgi:hypothetical protein